MVTAIIDYGSGNLRSAQKSFERAARETGAKTEILVTACPDRVAGAERVVLPGVGAFGDCRRGLHAVDGMVAAIRHAVEAKGRPFLGICVGMQLTATAGVEHGRHEGLGWIPGEVRRIAPGDRGLKIPHMGWNDLDDVARHPVLAGITPGMHGYFVHSYHLAAEHGHSVAARTDYGGPVTAAVAKDTVFGTQFHPEKSQALGLTLIGNFLAWRP